MNRRNPPDRRGLTLLEVMASLAITASLMASSMVVLRSSYATWRLHEDELDRASAAQAVLRRIVRGVRQSAVVEAITAESAPNGSLALERTDGQIETFTHAGSSVTYQLDSGPTHIVSDTVTHLTFTGFEADGVTVTTQPADVHSIRCVVTTTLPSGATRTASSYAWLRAW